jgi:hypothetical protein
MRVDRRAWPVLAQAPHVSTMGHRFGRPLVNGIARFLLATAAGAGLGAAAALARNRLVQQPAGAPAPPLPPATAAPSAPRAPEAAGPPGPASPPAAEPPAAPPPTQAAAGPAPEVDHDAQVAALEAARARLRARAAELRAEMEGRLRAGAGD